jgi:hypothetical protein
MSDDPCDQCGEHHEPLDDALKKWGRHYRGMTAGFFSSLALLAYSAYELVGPFGILVVTAGFGIHFFSLNMHFTGARMEAMGAAADVHAKQKETSDGGSPGQGLYL